jgi:hypothetical protein
MKATYSDPTVQPARIDNETNTDTPTVSPDATCEGRELPPFNEIWYTTSDEKALDFDENRELTNARLLSNSYVQGILRFDEVVTTIGDSAFEVRTSLRSITLPDSVTSIRDRAFGDCSDCA